MGTPSRTGDSTTTRTPHAQGLCHPGLAAVSVCRRAALIPLALIALAGLCLLMAGCSTTKIGAAGYETQRRETIFRMSPAPVPPTTTATTIIITSVPVEPKQ